MRKRFVVRLLITILKSFVQDGFANLLGSPLSTRFAQRFFSWLGLPVELPIPNELATRLEAYADIGSFPPVVSTWVVWNLYP